MAHCPGFLTHGMILNRYDFAMGTIALFSMPCCLARQLFASNDASENKDLLFSISCCPNKTWQMSNSQLSSLSSLSSFFSNAFCVMLTLQFELSEY